MPLTRLDAPTTAWPCRRSTVIQRDVLVERFFKGWSFNYQPEELAELSRMVRLGKDTLRGRKPCGVGAGTGCICSGARKQISEQQANIQHPGFAGTSNLCPSALLNSAQVDSSS